MAIHHVMLKVKDWKKAKEFYTQAFKPLGYEVVADWGTGGGFGVPGATSGNVYVRQGACLLCHNGLFFVPYGHLV